MKRLDVLESIKINHDELEGAKALLVKAAQHLSMAISDMPDGGPMEATHEQNEKVVAAVTELQNAALHFSATALANLSISARLL